MAEVAKNLAKVVGGVTLAIVALLIAVVFRSWGSATVAVIKGGIVLFIVMFGILLLLFGFTGLKE